MVQEDPDRVSGLGTRRVDDNGVIFPTAGDNSVDSVDSRVTDHSRSVTDDTHGADSPSDANGESPAQQPDDAATARTELRGSDLARAALEAARARSGTHRSASGASGRAGAAARGAHGAGGGAPRSRRRRWSSSGADDRDPQPLGRVASRLAAERGWKGRLTTGQIFGQWATLVGEEVAEHAQPQALHNGELTVRASSTAWATQLRLLQGQLLAKIAAGVGHGVVKRLKVQGPVAPSWRRGARHVPGRGPRDTYG